MDLRERLARLDRLSRPAASDPASDPASGPAADPSRTLTEALGLREEATPGGTIWIRRDRRDLAQAAGPVGDLSGIVATELPHDLAWSEMLFLDTETTGLAGGTGTLAFLIGLAWWEPDGGLRVRQLFLAGPGREGPVLDELARLASGFRVVVTYNGASFDLPLLRTRARMNRRHDPLGGLAGWDLLVAARRLWRRRLPDCRQQTIEAAVCGYERGPGDIDGALIPAAYQAYLTTGAAGALPEVLRHNRRDMEGMARVALAIAAEARAITDEAPRAGDWRAVWSRALICERRRDVARAASWARLLRDPVAQGRADPAAARDAIRLLKRVADWPAVRALVCAGLAHWPDDAHLHYEAAVLYEHRLRDYPRAMTHARRLADAHRLARLEARLARPAPPGCPPPPDAL
ncbi:hypothetical protein GF314_11245 [bacterium]|nr:hypothetical protein [bacterium]